MEDGVTLIDNDSLNLGIEILKEKLKVYIGKIIRDI